MNTFKTSNGNCILLPMVETIKKNKAYLSDLDGLIGDGDHGVNMNKGFLLFKNHFADKNLNFSDGLKELGMTLMNDIGGSMGPIYGTLFIGMGDKISNLSKLNLELFTLMVQNGYDELNQIIEAKIGDKTLIDTLVPSIISLRNSVEGKEDFEIALIKMKMQAQIGCNSTKLLKAKYGRASRLGDRSIGILDTGAVSCYLLLSTMADSIINILE